MITTSVNNTLDLLIEESFKTAQNLHGDLSLSLEDYRRRVVALLKGHIKRHGESDSIIFWFKRLHTNDLYLAFSCAYANEDAWKRFSALYNKPVYETALLVCRNRSQADEIAKSVIGHLFLPDSKGSPRIESYGGLSSLLTWLRVVITHKAVDEIRHRNRFSEPFDNLTEIIDDAGQHLPQRSIRRSLYEALIKEVLREAPQILNEQEKRLLKLRYQKGMKMGEIAALLGASQPNLTYRLKRTQKKLQQKVLEILQKRYNLGEAAIKECIDEILENPVYSLLDYME